MKKHLLTILILLNFCSIINAGEIQSQNTGQIKNLGPHIILCIEPYIISVNVESTTILNQTCYRNDGVFVFYPAATGCISFSFAGTIVFSPLYICSNAIIKGKFSDAGARQLSSYTFGFLGTHLLGLPCYLTKKVFWDAPCFVYDSIFGEDPEELAPDDEEKIEKKTCVSK